MIFQSKAVSWQLSKKLTGKNVIVLYENVKQIFFEFFFCLIVPHCNHETKLDHSSQTLENAISLSITPNPQECPQCAAALSLKEGEGSTGHSANGEEEESALKETDRDDNHLEERGDEDSEDTLKNERTCFGKCKDIWDEIRVKLWGIVESKYFNRGIMIAILINTISMGIEHHNQVISPAVHPV